MATPGGGGNNDVGTSQVTFNFVRAQSAITVPTETTSLRFEFFSGASGNGSLLLRETRPFAASITFDNVPTTAHSVVVTALDADRFPVTEFTASLNLVADQAVVVNATGGTTAPVLMTGLTANPAALVLGLEGSVKLVLSATFSNGDSVVLSDELLADEVTFSSDDTSTAAVAGDGTVSAVLAGETFVTASFRGETVAVPVTVSTGNAVPPLAQSLTVTPSSVSLPVGAISPKLEFTVTFPGGITRKVSSAQGVTFSSSVAGITVNSNDQIVIGNSVAPGTTAIVTGTYAGLRARVQVNVSTATLRSISVAPANVSLPFGGFEQRLVVTGSFSDGTNVELDPSGLTFTENSALFSVDAAGLLVTATSGTSGTSTVSISHKTITVNPATASITVGAVTVNSLITERDGEQVTSVTLTAGEFAEMVVKAELSDGNIIDVSEFAVLQTTLTGSGVVINKGRVVGVSPGSTATVKYTLPGAGVGGANVSADLTVTVEALTLTSVEYFFAGNPIAASAQTVNLPRGYVGVFEVVGTFSNGAVRKLRASEYTLTKNGGDRNPDAIQFLNSSYQLRKPDGTFYDNQSEDSSAFDSITAVIDDLLGLPTLTTVRSISTVATQDSSNDRTFVAKDSFRAVVADWFIDGTFLENGTYVPPFQTSGFSSPNNQIDAPNSSARIVIGVTGYPQFNRTVSVTITDPAGQPTISGVEFANYPGDPNIPRGTPRELVVRINFPAATVGASRPPHVGPQGNFKLAEANVAFATDDLPDTPGVRPSYRQVLHHRVTELGFIGITSDVPYDVGTLSVAASPIGGAVSAPILITAPSGAGTTASPYVAGTYGKYLAVFGQSSGLDSEETPNYIPSRDPGPNTDNAAVTRAPDDRIRRLYTVFNNGGAGFRIVNPVLFTIEPANAGLVLEVGQSQLFRTIAQWSATEEVKDVSLDYRPELPAAEADVVGRPDSDTGHLTVSGVIQGGSATVTAFDVAGAAITAAGPDARNNTVINVVAPTP